MRRSLLWIFSVLLSFIWLQTSYANTEHDFTKANKFYQNGEYTQAITLYQKLHKSGIVNASLFFNLANAYYKTENYGEAILFYEKAKKLDPGNEDINFNIKIANTKIIDKFNNDEKVTLYHYYIDFINVFHSNTWVYLSIIFLSLCAFFTYRVIFAKSAWNKQISLFLAIMAIGIFLISTLFAYSTYNYSVNTQFVIVLTDNAFVKNSPQDNGKDLIMLHSGTKLEILERNEKWLKVKMPDGNVGWVEQAKIGEV